LSNCLRLVDRNVKATYRVVLSIVFVTLIGSARAEFTGQAPLGEAVCGPVASGGFGPFDYRTIKSGDKHLVESAHFTTQVEMLVRGVTAAGPGGDIDYTLRAIPNHARALSAMVRLGDRLKSDKPPGARSRLECYFDRAIRLAPDDGRIYVIYADWLRRNGRTAEAGLALGLAERYGPNDPMLLYNAGLIWLDMQQPDRALPLAKRAYEGGVQLQGLRTRLEAAGKWTQ
jgi:uncharacterized protein (TIGR02996 family)